MIFRRLFGRTPQEEQQKQEVALTKTRRTNLFGSLFERSTIDEELYEDLETALIGSDVGVETTNMLINDLRAHVRQQWHPRPEGGEGASQRRDGLPARRHASASAP